MNDWYILNPGSNEWMALAQLMTKEDIGWLQQHVCLGVCGRFVKWSWSSWKSPVPLFDACQPACGPIRHWLVSPKLPLACGSCNGPSINNKYCKAWNFNGNFVWTLLMLWFARTSCTRGSPLLVTKVFEMWWWKQSTLTFAFPCWIFWFRPTI